MSQVLIIDFANVNQLEGCECSLCGTGYFANISIRIIRALFHIKQKNCAMLAIRQLPYNLENKNSEVIDYFEEVFS